MRRPAQQSLQFELRTNADEYLRGGRLAHYESAELPFNIIYIMRSMLGLSRSSSTKRFSVTPPGPSDIGLLSHRVAPGVSERI
jgi:hypothetical protein